MFKAFDFSLNLAVASFITLAPAWDEPQRFGFFRKATIAGNPDSVWVVGNSSGMTYPAFLFTGNAWQSIDRDQASRHISEPITQPLEGGIEVILDNGTRYWFHPENGRIHIQLITDKYKSYYENPTYSRSDSIAGLSHLQVMSINDEQMLIYAGIDLRRLDDSTRSRYRSQLYSVDSAHEAFSAQIVVFDLLGKVWHYYPSPPLKASLACGALAAKQIWLGSATFSEMGTPHEGAGVAVFDLAEQRYTIFTSKNSGLLDDGILSIRGVWKIALGNNEPIYTARSTTSQPIAVFVGAETGAEVEIIEQGDEWLKVRIVQGWIPAEAVLPQVVEMD